MAVLTLSVRDITPVSAIVDWDITDVGSIITTVGIANEAASGSKIAPSVIYSSAPTVGLGGSGSLTVTPDMCTDGVFGCYGYGYDGQWYYSAGGFKSIKIEFVVRPTNWSWNSTVSSGSDIRLTANEWMMFCARINEFRAYKGLSQHSFDNVVSGVTKISASIVNAARSAILEMSPGVTLPSAVSAGSEISAYFFNGLKDSLNSIM